MRNGEHRNGLLVVDMDRTVEGRKRCGLPDRLRYCASLLYPEFNSQQKTSGISRKIVLLAQRLGRFPCMCRLLRAVPSRHDDLPGESGRC